MMLSIIIPSNVLDRQFERCLRSVEQISAVEEFELIVVLDGLASDDFFDQFALPNLTIIELADNKGPAFARNQGAQAATGDLLFFMDADVTLHTNTISQINSSFKSANAPDAVIGSYDDEPEYPSLVSRFRNLLHHYTHQHASAKASTFWSACGAIRKDVFLSLNGFNTDYKKPSVEDIELGYRLIESGGCIRLDKDIQVKHLKRWTLFSMIQTDVMRRAIPWTKLTRYYTQIEHKDLNLKRREKVAAALVALVMICLIAGMVMSPLLFAPSLIVTLALLVLNSEFYAYLRSRFSVILLPAVILLHWVYYLSAITGYFIGNVGYLFGARKRVDFNGNLGNSSSRWLSKKAPLSSGRGPQG